jgi:hypothetical protein
VEPPLYTRLIPTLENRLACTPSPPVQPPVGGASLGHPIVIQDSSPHEQKPSLRSPFAISVSTGSPVSPVQHLTRKRPRSPSVEIISPPNKKLSKVTPSYSASHPSQIRKFSHSPSISLISPVTKKPLPVSLKTSPGPSIIPARGHVTEGTTFDSMEAALQAVMDEQRHLGYKWRRNQSKRDANNEFKKITAHCSGSGTYTPSMTQILILEIIDAPRQSKLNALLLLILTRQYPSYGR